MSPPSSPRRAGSARRVLLDGAQAVQHGPQDVQALGVDFYAFSGHKCFGPGGVGVLWARGELLAAMPPFHGGGGMIGTVTTEGYTWAEPPRRFEAGTPPIAQAVGLGRRAGLDDGPRLGADPRPRSALCEALIDGLRRIPEVRLLGPEPSSARAPIVSFDIAGLHPHDICQVLDAEGLACAAATTAPSRCWRRWGSRPAPVPVSRSTTTRPMSRRCWRVSCAPSGCSGEPRDEWRRSALSGSHQGLRARRPRPRPARSAPARRCARQSPCAAIASACR
jgi:selenocysteine lyase/cysteine desulfurase